jgi:hypothetical protein
MMSQRVYLKEEIHRPVGDLVKEQIVEWQSALVRIISFTEAKSPAGAMVQMALALDEMDSMIELLDEENQKLVGHHRNQIDRQRCVGCGRRSEPNSSQLRQLSTFTRAACTTGLTKWRRGRRKAGRIVRASPIDRPKGESGRAADK